jgi:3-oxoadipate enol-lactonase
VSPARLHYELSGPDDGPVLVFGGSLGTTLAMWDPQAARLAGRRRILRYDHRGHGGSPALSGPYAIEELGRDVLDLLDGLGCERASYCGLSLGGMVGMWLAANAPERIQRLILLCTSARLPPPAAYRDRAAAVRAAGTPEVVADAVLARWLTPAWAQENPGPAAGLRAMFSQVSAEGYAGCCEAIAALDLRAELERITARTVVVAGAEDPATPPKHAELIAAAIPGARLVVLERAAHLASVERADAVTDLIADHLDRRRDDERPDPRRRHDRPPRGARRQLCRRCRRADR